MIDQENLYHLRSLSSIHVQPLLFHQQITCDLEIIYETIIMMMTTNYRWNRTMLALLLNQIHKNNQRRKTLVQIDIRSKLKKLDRKKHQLPQGKSSQCKYMSCLRNKLMGYIDVHCVQINKRWRDFFLTHSWIVLQNNLLSRIRMT